jgi:hypothetical protein
MKLGAGSGTLGAVGGRGAIAGVGGVTIPMQ